MCLLLVLLVNWSQMKPAIGPFLCVILNFVCCHLLNNAASGAWGSDVACVCAECCHVCGFPAELGYFNTVAAGCFSCPRVEATPITWYLAPGMRTIPRNPPRNAIGLVLSSNWAGFVAKTWQPWISAPEVRHRKRDKTRRNNVITFRFVSFWSTKMKRHFSIVFIL